MSDIKTSWILRLKELVTGPLGRIDRLTNRVGNSLNRTQGKLDKFGVRKAAIFGRISNLASNLIPSIGGVTSSLSGMVGMAGGGGAALAGIGSAALGPIAAVGIALVGTIALLGKGVEAAEEFNHQFLELRQLNLDKTEAQLDRLNDKVLDLSFRVGSNATATAKAYFDIQSATGKYGDEVDTIVEKTAKFSQITKTDLNSAINGVAKSINAFNLQVDDLDNYLESSFRTVQVGITTFDELAKVQTEYAASAAAIGQGYDQANKVFAAFSTISKNVDIAATQTKTAFEALTRKSTIDGLKGIGVEMFDTGGHMRNLNDIIKDTIPILGKMNDYEFAKLKESIGGTEGLRALFDQMRVSGDKMLQSFEMFDSTKFDLSTAIKNANGDLTILKGILSNRINNLFIRLGQLVMPHVVETVGLVADKLYEWVTTFQNVYRKSTFVRDIFKAIWFYTTIGWRVLGEIWDIISAIATGVGKLVLGIINFVRELFGLEKLDVGEAMFGNFEYWYRVFKSIMVQVFDGLGSFYDSVLEAFSGNFQQAWDKIIAGKDGLLSIDWDQTKRFVDNDIWAERKAAKEGGEPSLYERIIMGGNGSATGSSSGYDVSGVGSGGSRSLTMNLTVNAPVTFSKDFDGDKRKAHQDLVKLIVDAGRDASVILNNG